jgi:exosome complex component RRP4
MDLENDQVMSHFVTPGEVITEDPAFMRGHGTYRQEGCLRAAVAGYVERTNMLVSVLPLRSRYMGDIGDVVIGRITVVGNKRWKVECNARQDSVLHLSSIYLPGGIQRRKSEEDELQMRTFFAEGEIICAEVQSLYADGAIGIHTRNLRYGKLVTGELLRVQSSLVKRQKSHFLVIPKLNVEVILGMNGMVWVGKPRRTAVNQEDLDAMYSSKLDLVTPDERRNIILVRNAIKELDASFHYIDEHSIISTVRSISEK